MVTSWFELLPLKQPDNCNELIDLRNHDYFFLKSNTKKPIINVLIMSAETATRYSGIFLDLFRCLL